MLATISRRVDGLLAASAVLLLTGLLVSVFLGVVCRLLDRPLSWTDEMARYLLVWTGFTGWILAGRRGSHIRVTALVDRLPAAPRRWLEIAIQLAVALLGTILLTQSGGLLARNMDVEWVSLPLPVALLYVPVPVAGLAIVLQSGVGIARAWRSGHAP